MTINSIFGSIKIKLACIIFIMGSLTWLIFINIPSHSDDTGYMLVAKSVENIKFFSYSHYAHRTGFVLPLLAFNKLFGFGLIPYYVFSYMAFALRLFGFMMVAGLTFTDKRVALLACIIFISSGPINHTTSLLYPDVLCTAYNLLAFGLFILSIRIDSIRASHWLILLSAFLGFLGFLCKMTSSIYLLAIPCYEIFVCGKLSRFVRFMIYVVLFLLLDLLYSTLIHNDMFIRYTNLFGIVNQQSNIGEVFSFIDYLLRAPRALWQYNGAIFLMVAGLPGTILAISRKNYELISFGIGAILIYSSFALLVHSWSPLIPAMNFVLRYYHMFLTYLVLASAVLIVYVIDISVKYVKISKPTLMATAIIGILLFQCTNYYIYFNRFMLIKVGQNKYYNAGIKFGKTLENHPEIFDHNVYTLSEKNFGMYPNFNRLKMIDAERFQRPNAPAYVLSDEFDINFYADQFSALGKLDLGDYYLSLMRKSRHAHILFKDGGIFLVKMDKWVEKKDLIFSLNDKLLTDETESIIVFPHDCLQLEVKTNAVKFSTLPSIKSSCKNIDIVFTPQELAFLKGKSPHTYSPATYQVLLKARIPKGINVTLEVVEYANDKIINTSQRIFKPFDFDQGVTQHYDHILRLYDFRTNPSTNKIELRLSCPLSSREIVVEGLSVFKFEE